MNRVILHSDLNSYFASVECMKNPELKKYPVAVCGNTEERCGIVLAKNNIAKQYNIITGESVCSALSKCHNLVVVSPHYDEYVKYSQLTRRIYDRYTDRIEPFGIDECWLDVTESIKLFGSGEQIANDIRKAVFAELGLTVSVGVSFTKSFSKIGSDIKKPNAVTCFPYESFKTDVWNLPVNMLIGVGYSTIKKLFILGIKTIGDLANYPQEALTNKLGKCGLMLWLCANGLDMSPVQKKDYHTPIKSIGHSSTTICDLDNEEDALNVISELCDNIGYRLRNARLCAYGICVGVRDNSLEVKEFQQKQMLPIRSTRDIAFAAKNIFKSNYSWNKNIRSVSIRVFSLVPYDIPTQLDMFSDTEKINRHEKIDDVIDSIREKYGKQMVYTATHLKELKIPKDKATEKIPCFMYL